MGRPKLEIDEELVRKLAHIQCTQDEIAVIVGCSVDTLQRRFAVAIKEEKERGKSSLRRLQWKSANDGNVTMQIWLGKQILDQTDRSRVESEVTHKKAREEDGFDKFLREHPELTEGAIDAYTDNGKTDPKQP